MGRLMKLNDGTRTGGEILVEQLVAQGVKEAFCVPGESYLAALDAFYDRNIELIVCRQEGGAAFMAEAVGKATGRPGICFVTRGPGATNASAGIHIAKQDSTPMIVFVGQIARSMREREAFQELDYRAVFGSMAKWATEIDDPARIPEIVSRAFFTAMSGRPGPVVIGLPEDMLTQRVSVADANRVEAVETSPGPAEMAKLQKLLDESTNPFIIVGGSRWSQDSCDSLARFADKFSIPVATTFRRGAMYDASQLTYAGDLGIGPNPKLMDRLKASDLVMLIGGRLGEMPSQSYTLFSIPTPQMKFIHVHPGSDELGRVYHPTLAINSTPGAFAAAAEKLTPPKTIAWSDTTKQAHIDYLTWTEKATPQPGGVNLGEVIVWLRDELGPDAVIANGAGNFAGWVHRFYRFRRFGTHIAPTCGSMGYGVPAAVAMKHLCKGRQVVCIAGDGDFLMNGQEFATAVQYNLPIIIVISDNGIYGTIMMHQEREYPGRIIGTKIRNPDFVAYAKAFGGFGVLVEASADFPAAYAAAVKSGKPAIIHLKVNPEAITPNATLGAIREKALAGNRH